MSQTTTIAALCRVMEYQVAQTLPASPLSLDSDALLALRLVSAQVEEHFHRHVWPVYEEALKRTKRVQFGQLLTALRFWPSERLPTLIDWATRWPKGKARRLFVRRCLYDLLDQPDTSYNYMKMRQQAELARLEMSKMQELAKQRPGDLDHSTLYQDMLLAYRSAHHALSDYEKRATELARYLGEALYPGYPWRWQLLLGLVRVCENLLETPAQIQPPHAYLHTLLKGPLMPLVLDDNHVWHMWVKDAVSTHLPVLQSLREGFERAVDRLLDDPPALQQLVRQHIGLFRSNASNSAEKERPERLQVLMDALFRYNQLPVYTLCQLRQNDALVTECLRAAPYSLRLQPRQMATQLQDLLTQLLSAQRYSEMCDLMDLRCAQEALSGSIDWKCPLLCHALAQCPLSLVPRLAERMPMWQQRDVSVLADMHPKRLFLWLRHAPTSLSQNQKMHVSVGTLIRRALAQNWQGECTLQTWRRYLRLAAIAQPPWPEPPPVRASMQCICGSPLARCLTRLAAVLQQIWVPSELTLRVEAKQLHRQQVCEYLDQMAECEAVEDDGETLWDYGASDEEAEEEAEEDEHK